MNITLKKRGPLNHNRMIPAQVRFTQRQLDYIDDLVMEEEYTCRSDAIRDCVRRRMEELHSSKRNIKKGG